MEHKFYKNSWVVSTVVIAFITSLALGSVAPLWADESFQQIPEDRSLQPGERGVDSQTPPMPMSLPNRIFNSPTSTEWMQQGLGGVTGGANLSGGSLTRDPLIERPLPPFRRPPNPNPQSHEQSGEFFCVIDIHSQSKCRPKTADDQVDPITPELAASLAATLSYLAGVLGIDPSQITGIRRMGYGWDVTYTATSGGGAGRRAKWGQRTISIV